MKKYLEATKCKDGYYVTITIVVTTSDLTDVRDIIRYEGLKESKQFSIWPDKETGETRTIIKAF